MGIFRYPSSGQPSSDNLDKKRRSFADFRGLPLKWVCGLNHLKKGSPQIPPTFLYGEKNAGQQQTTTFLWEKKGLRSVRWIGLDVPARKELLGSMVVVSATFRWDILGL